MKVIPNYEENAVDLPSDGRHVFRVTGCWRKTRKDKTTGEEIPYLSWELTVAKGAEEGRKVDLHTTIGGKHAWILRTWVQCFVHGYQDGEFDTDAIVGKMVEAEVQNKLYEGKPSRFPRIQHWAPYAAASEVPELPTFDAEEDVPF